MADLVEHHGNGVPVQDSNQVIVRFRDGLVGAGRASLWMASKRTGRCRWVHLGKPDDIVAYAVSWRARAAQ